MRMGSDALDRPVATGQTHNDSAGSECGRAVSSDRYGLKVMHGGGALAAQPDATVETVQARGRTAIAATRIGSPCPPPGAAAIRVLGTEMPCGQNAGHARQCIIGSSVLRIAWIFFPQNPSAPRVAQVLAGTPFARDGGSHGTSNHRRRRSSHKPDRAQAGGRDPQPTRQPPRLHAGPA